MTKYILDSSSNSTWRYGLDKSIFENFLPLGRLLGRLLSRLLGRLLGRLLATLLGRLQGRVADK